MRNRNPHLRRTIDIDETGNHVRYLVTGPKGATQLLFMYSNVTGWFGADFGYHSPKPMYSDHESMPNCDVLGEVDCYYDGSGLRAGPYLKYHLDENHTSIFDALEDEYYLLFDPDNPHRAL